MPGKQDQRLSANSKFLIDYELLLNKNTLEICLTNFSGGVAQLGEHLLCKQGVIGSIPFTSTINSRVQK